ncbi:hypothetical protein QBC39DRAFT_326644 [Podospora conica]|nr:hypothetical protein QBC39DRAFT_326644 [Schizothecium conicum]
MLLYSLILMFLTFLALRLILRVTFASDLEIPPARKFKVNKRIIAAGASTSTFCDEILTLTTPIIPLAPNKRSTARGASTLRRGINSSTTLYYEEELLYRYYEEEAYA